MHNMLKQNNLLQKCNFTVKSRPRNAKESEGWFGEREEEDKIVYYAPTEEITWIVHISCKLTRDVGWPILVP